MCIGELSISNITGKMGIAEGNMEFNNEVLLAFKNANFTDKRFSFYQKGFLCRYQFLEFTARLAHKKYIETKQTDSYFDALSRLFSKHLFNKDDYFKAFAAQYDDNRWKENLYWCEQMDELYTTYIKLIEWLYANYSGLRAKPGKASFMSLEEFRSLIMDFGLEELFPNSEIPICYNLAMMTQIDEINNERCAEMIQVEFMEALAHIADLADLQGLEIPEDIIRANNQKVPLCLKTEALLKKISKSTIIPKRALDGFKLSDKRLFDKKGQILEDD
jgi:hypothetical protein